MVIKYKQDNGLTVILEPIKESVSVSVGMWIKAGSRDELENQFGYAHFIEHMLFKGTKKYSAKDIASIVDRVGGQHNAATNREYTCYYINVVSDYLELAVHILADMYRNSVFAEKEISREKNVIIEEIRMYEDTPDEFIHDLFVENMLAGHPLSHSILGSIDIIDSVNRKKLMSYYSRMYSDSNAIFVIAGNFDESDARRFIEQYLGDSVTADSSARSLPGDQPSREMFCHSEKDLEQVHFCLGTGGIKRDDPDRWALYALSTILGGSMSSRLFQTIREREGLSYSIYSFHSSYSDTGIFGIYCATVPDKFRRAVSLIMDECRKIEKQGITEKELQDARTYMIGNLALSMESIEVRMGQLARNEITYGRHFGFNEIVEIINNISLDDFHRISHKLFHDTQVSLISVGNLNGFDISELDLHI